MLLGEDIQAVRVSVEGDCLHCRDRGVEEKVVPWGPGAGAWRRVRRQPWQEFEPRVDLVFVEELAAGNLAERGLWAERRSRIEAARFLLDRWPAEARERVRRLPGNHWQLLRFVNRGGEAALQVLRTNLALAFLLATAENVPAGLPELLGRRRREVLPLFGFPASEQAVRLLQKVPAGCVKAEAIADLREASAEAATANWLSRLPRINPVVLAIARDPALRDRFSPACLARLARSARPLPQCDLAARVREMAGRAERERAPVPPIRSLADIDNAFRPRPPAAHQANPARGRRPIPERFPPPPLAAPDGMEPIETRVGLSEEGALMHHCVGGASYARQIANGCLYVYRMTAPERLTIAIRKTGRVWRISEVQGPCNRPARAESIRHIRAWLAEPEPEPVAPPPPPPVFGAAERPGARPRPRRARETAQMSFDFAAS